MVQKSCLLLVIVAALISCQFTETMVLNEDGSGRMSIKMDLSEMITLSNELTQDSTIRKTDTIISFKDVLTVKKDSIEKLSKKEQQQLKVMESYNVHLVSDPNRNKMAVDIFINFQDVSQANDLMKGLEDSDNLLPNMGAGAKENNFSEGNVAVFYSFSEGVFKRDAYIKDIKKHKKQVDSMTNIASFMKGMNYNIRYTFPRKIKNSSLPNATYSLDGKTIEVEKPFIAYIKNPDLLDLVIELEK